MRSRLRVKMRLIVRQDKRTAASYLADALVDRITTFSPTTERPFVLGLSAGRDTELVYQRLVERFKASDISFKHVVIFYMLEYVGLHQDHLQTFHSYMYHHLFNHIDINPDNVHIPNGNADNLDEECQAYEQKIKEAGGIEMFLSGMGADQHVAFSESGLGLSSRTAVKTLGSNAIKPNAKFFKGNEFKVPKTVLTAGIQTIMDAREVAIITTGNHEASAVKNILEGGVNVVRPFSALHAHRNAMMIADEAATTELNAQTVTRSKDRELVAYRQRIKHHLYRSAVAAMERPLGSIIGPRESQDDGTDYTDQVKFAPKNMRSLQILQLSRPRVH